MKTLHMLPALLLSFTLTIPAAFAQDYSLKYYSKGAVDEAIDKVGNGKIAQLDDDSDDDSADLQDDDGENGDDSNAEGDAVEGRAETVKADADICSRIEGKLTQVQSMAIDLDNSAFKKTDEKLKEMYISACEKKSADSHAVAEMHKQLDQLDASIAYTDMVVKKKGKRKIKGKTAYRKGKKSRNGKKRSRSGGGKTVVVDTRGGPRILGMFEPAHKICAPGCGYVSWGIWGDVAHQRRASCHNSGDAIDIHAIRCGGTVYSAPMQPGVASPRFDQYVSCMASQGLGKVYRTRTKTMDHYDHAHLQLPNCRKIRTR